MPMKTPEEWAYLVRNGFLGWSDDVFFGDRGEAFEEAIAWYIREIQMDALTEAAKVVRKGCPPHHQPRYLWLHRAAEAVLDLLNPEDV